MFFAANCSNINQLKNEHLCFSCYLRSLFVPELTQTIRIMYEIMHVIMFEITHVIIFEITHVIMYEITHVIMYEIMHVIMLEITHVFMFEIELVIRHKHSKDLSLQ